MTVQRNTSLAGSVRASGICCCGTQERALRLRYPNGFTKLTLMVPGQVYEAEVRMRDFARLVKPGHKLRLHITGPSFPRLSLNMNGGGDPHRETKPNPAQITIHMAKDTPLSLRQFVLPG